jgi:hypothetical protein
MLKINFKIKEKNLGFTSLNGYSLHGQSLKFDFLKSHSVFSVLKRKSSDS